MKTIIFNTIITIILILTIVFFIVDFNNARVYTNQNSEIIKKTFQPEKVKLTNTSFNQAILNINIEKQHYVYELKLNDTNLNYLIHNEKEYNIGDSFKTNFKVGKYTNIVYDFKIL